MSLGMSKAKAGRDDRKISKTNTRARLGKDDRSVSSEYETSKSMELSRRGDRKDPREDRTRSRDDRTRSRGDRNDPKMRTQDPRRDRDSSRQDKDGSRTGRSEPRRERSNSRRSRDDSRREISGSRHAHSRSSKDRDRSEKDRDRSVKDRDRSEKDQDRYNRDRDRYKKDLDDPRRHLDPSRKDLDRTTRERDRSRQDLDGYKKDFSKTSIDRDGSRKDRGHTRDEGRDSRRDKLDDRDDRKSSRRGDDRDERKSSRRGDESDEIYKLKKELASKIRRYELKIQKFYEMAKSKGKGYVSDEDFKIIITKDIRFKIKPEEMDVLLEYYSKKGSRGIIDFKKFSDDMYALNNRDRGSSKRLEESKNFNDTRKSIDPRDDRRQGRDDRDRRTADRGSRDPRDPRDDRSTKSLRDGRDGRDGRDRRDDRDARRSTQELEFSLKPSPNLPSEPRYSMRNTVVGRFSDSRRVEKYKIKLSESIMEDIIKLTYLRDKLIEDAFMKYGSGRAKAISYDKFLDAFEAYGIKLDTKSLQSTYEKLVGNNPELTAGLIDVAIEDNAKKGIEEIQKSIMDMINRAIKSTGEKDLKEIFLKADANNKGILTFEEFSRCVSNVAPKVKHSDILFLAKRYCQKTENSVQYEIMLNEIEMINQGLNPLMSWAEELAETIVKAVTANNTDFETIFKKYAPGQTFITEKQFLTAMKDIRVESKFDRNKIMRFYYYIDDDKSQKVEFRELESIIKTHCKKSVKELAESTFATLDAEMQERKIDFEKLHSTLKDFARGDLIDAKSLRKGILTKLHLKVNDIDIDFICQTYKDKTDSRSINLTKFLSDFADKLGIKDVNVMSRTLKMKDRERSVSSPVPKIKAIGRKDFSTPKRQTDEMNMIIRELRVEAHDRQIDLAREFQRIHQDGQLTDKEFKDVLYDCRIKMNSNDIQKIIDRFMNTIGNTIDTNVLLDNMHNRGDSSNRPSSSKNLKMIVEKGILAKIAKKLHKKGLVNKIIRNLEDLDEKDTDHLDFNNIKKAFHKAEFKLSTEQTREMLEDIKTNKEKEYNYHILLCSLFGDNYKKEIVIDGKVIPSKSKFRKEDGRSRDHGRSRDDGRGSRSRGDKHRLETDDSRRRHTAKSGQKGRTGSRRHGEVARGSRTDEVGRSKTRHDGKSRDRSSIGKDRSLRPRGKVRDNESVSDSEYEDRGDNRRDDSRNRSRSKNRVSKTPLGKQAKEIGKKLETSRYDFYSHLRHFAGEDKDYILTDDQVFKILGAARVKISKQEEDDFIRDMGDTRFTVEEFLINCNLNVAEFGGEKVDVEVSLTPEEREHAKKLCTEIGQAIDHEKKEFERIFNIGPYDKDTDFQEFKFGIENEINDDVSKIAADMRSVSLLKNYLVEDINRNDKINVKKLFNALFPEDDGKPEVKTRMNCVTDFIQYLRENPEIDIDKEFREGMSHEEFMNKLEEIGYDVSAQNKEKLVESFTNTRAEGKISKNLIRRNINLLSPDLLNKANAPNKKQVTDRLDTVDPKIKKTLVKINTYLKKERLDTMTFFEYCDADGDGLLTDDEFVKGVMHWKIVGLKDHHLRDAFRIMNVNNDESLSLGEVFMYIDGAKPTKQDRENVLEKEIKFGMEEQINDLFNEFKDEGKNVTKESMQRILTGFDIPANVISKTLNNVRTDNDGKISKKNFKKYMTDFLMDLLMEAEQDVNELRALFYEADLNSSGFLDMDELYNFFNVRLEANVTRDELRQLVQGVDLDFDGQVDIDEFINLMSKKPSEKGGSGGADATYMRIKRSRKFDMTEFIKFLKKFPDHFQESFSARLYKNKHCLPSSAFLSSIIPHDEQSLKVSKKVKAEPTIKTSEPLDAAQILLEGAKGVPSPEHDKISIEEISKRIVRTTIYDFDAKRFIGNSSFVVAEYNPKYPDQWKFNKWGDTGLNPLILRTDLHECIEKNISVIFEFVIY